MKPELVDVWVDGRQVDHLMAQRILIRCLRQLLATPAATRRHALSDARWGQQLAAMALVSSLPAWLAATGLCLRRAVCRRVGRLAAAATLSQPTLEFCNTCSQDAYLLECDRQHSLEFGDACVTRVDRVHA